MSVRFSGRGTSLGSHDLSQSLQPPAERTGVQQL
jgi:hypothetical protein